MDNKERIKKMLEDGKISQKQADTLMNSLEESDKRKKNVFKGVSEVKESRDNKFLMFLILVFLSVIVCVAVFIMVVSSIQKVGSHMSSAGVVFLFVFIILVICAISIIFLILYNILVRREEFTNASWFEIGNLYQRKFDLIPALLGVAEKYSVHEKEILNNVSSARSDVKDVWLACQEATSLNKDGIQVLEQLYEALKKSLSKLKIIIENYPDLKADSQYSSLQAQITNTEDGIAKARSKYNNRVNIYNTVLRIFPVNIVAILFKFQPKEYFEKESGKE